MRSFTLGFDSLALTGPSHGPVNGRKGRYHLLGCDCGSVKISCNYAQKQIPMLAIQLEKDTPVELL